MMIVLMIRSDKVMGTHLLRQVYNLIEDYVSQVMG
jgi:hypothetical protein